MKEEDTSKKRSPECSSSSSSMFSRLHCPFSFRHGGSGKGGNNLDTKINVNEEYLEAFRTKSYIEISTKVQCQLKNSKSITKLSPSPPPSSVVSFSHLSESLLEPRQETLADLFEGFDLHHLLLDYFEASLKVCGICEVLLKCIHQTRANYRIIKRVINRTRVVLPHNGAKSGYDQSIAFGELRTFSLLKNPFSAVTGKHFREIHDGQKSLFRRLNSRSKRIRRRVKVVKIYKKVAGFGLVISYTAIATALLVLIVHSIVGIVAAPGLVGGCSFVLKKRKAVGRSRKTTTREGISGGLETRRRIGMQLDVAAKGVYILINDFDTMSRLVRRLHDQVEHGKAIAEICVRNGKGEVLKEVVKEFDAQEKCFMEQLEELEEHIYLCFVNINRSRRLVIQQILAPQQ